MNSVREIDARNALPQEARAQHIAGEVTRGIGSTNAPTCSSLEQVGVGSGR
jgi:hypothetical protein